MHWGDDFFKSDFDKESSRLTRLFWVVFIVIVVLIVVGVAIQIAGGVWVLTHPEAVGDWLNRLLQGLKGAK